MILDDDAEGKMLGIEMLSLSKRAGRLDLDNFLYQTRGVVAGG